MTESLIVLPYNLPDADLLTDPVGKGRAAVFVPERVMVVIGKGSDPELELLTDNIRADNIPVLRRGTGGCAVVLSPNMLVASFAVYGAEQRKSSEYFREFNQVIVRALEGLAITELSHAGISDIAHRQRKIAGSALYRNRVTVFYHAVINLAGGTDLMSRYLKHPPRTPDYREGRSHEEFVTSLAAEGFAVEPEYIRKRIEIEFQDYMTKSEVM